MLKKVTLRDSLWKCGQSLRPRLSEYLIENHTPLHSFHFIRFASLNDVTSFRRNAHCGLQGQKATTQ
jgi:hypothetical protein